MKKSGQKELHKGLSSHIHNHSEKEKVREDILQNLRNAHLKLTPRRLSIIQVLITHREPLSIEDIVKISRSKMDIVTAYRTLESFVNTRIAKRVMLSSEKSHYELDRGHHHHIVCTTCGDTEDVTECDLAGVVKHITRGSSKFISVLDHSLEFFGICKRCAK